MTFVDPRSDNLLVMGRCSKCNGSSIKMRGASFEDNRLKTGSIECLLCGYTQQAGETTNEPQQSLPSLIRFGEQL